MQQQIDQSAIALEEVLEDMAAFNNREQNKINSHNSLYEATKAQLIETWNA